MSGTYRFQVCITRDGVGRHGSTARGGAAEMKKIDRRMKRRQASRITRDALREHDESQALDMREMMYLMADYEEYDVYECESLYDVNDDFNHDYWNGDYGNQPGDDGWDDPHDGYYWDQYAEADEDYHLRNYPLHDDFDFRDELKCPSEKEAVQEGVSLGDILARIRKEKGME